MANRNFNRFQALEKEAKVLYVDIAIGSAGAPTLTKGLGIASVANPSTGVYVLTLDDKYNRLLDCSAHILSATAQDASIQLQDEDVASAKTVTLRVQDATATEVDPASGSRILAQIHLKNSSI